jgi:Ca2+-binding RTX toxin-like protein
MAKIYGTSGKDNPLWGTTGNDSIYGLAGDDFILTSDGDDYVEAGDGDDGVNSYYLENREYRYFPVTGTATIYGNAGNDLLTGKSGDDVIYGGTGDDEIRGSSGHDLLSGDEGDDSLYGGDGNDRIFGENGNDKIYTQDGNEVVDCGSGDDVVNFEFDKSGSPFYYLFTGSSVIDGGAGNDNITGTTGNDRIYGGIGDDVINGLSGNDNLEGGDGNDKIAGWTGNDSIVGGNGNDELSGNEESDTLDGGDGNDTLNGGDGNDILIGGKGGDNLSGGNGDDVYYLDDLLDSVYDSGGNDTAYVSGNFVKVPSSIEKIIYVNGAIALPYWIDALVLDGASGLYYKNLLGNSKTFYFTFPNSIPSYNTNPDDANGFTPFSNQQITQTKIALGVISELIDIKFTSTANSNAVNTISFASNTQSSGGYAGYPSDGVGGSDVFLSNQDAYKTLLDGSFGAYTLMHEIGHALGLKHPFDTSHPFETSSPLKGTEESTAWTYMSYNYSSENFILNYSPFDIASLQYIYGPSQTTRTGDDTYIVSASKANFVWDGKGKDTLDASSLSQGATLYLTPGYWGFVGTAAATTITSAGQVTVNFGTVLENLTGSELADKLYGNEVANLIHGGSGNDLIEGWDGNDILNGGQGTDQLNGGTGIDTAQFNGAWGNYKTSMTNNIFIVTDQKSGNDGTDSLTGIERLKFTDKSIAIDLDGNAGITAKVIGAVLGSSSVKNPTYVGIGLSYTDKGMSYSALGALALSAVGATTNDAIVTTLWRNVVGFNPSTADKAPFVKMLADGMKAGDLVVLAADTALNTTNIGLVGLIQTGIEYTSV